MFSRLYEIENSNERYNVIQNNRTPYVVETYDPTDYEPGIMLFFTGEQVDQKGHVEIGGTSFPYKCFDLFNPILFTTPEVVKIVSDNNSDISICRVCVLLPLIMCKITVYYPVSDICINYETGILYQREPDEIIPTFSTVISCIDPGLMLDAMLSAQGLECVLEFLSVSEVVDSD